MRLGAQVVSGIGFLGAGTIIVTKHNQIKGLTTAAGLWACAGVGLALGIGFYEAAILAGGLIYVILTIMQFWDNRMRKNTKFLELYLEISKSMNIGTILHTFKELNISVESLRFEPDEGLSKDTRSLIVALKAGSRFDHNEAMAVLRRIEGIHYLEEL